MSSFHFDKASAIFLCKSDRDLPALCRDLQSQYHLPYFSFHEHSAWEYARSANERLGFNITKTERFDIIAQWTEGSFTDVNYQIILYIAAVNGNTSIDSEKIIQDICIYLGQALQAQIVQIFPKKQ